jgi:hypothetical protein
MAEIVTVIFDIDGVLTDPTQAEVEPDLRSFFQQQGDIVEATGVDHYVFPGVKELMKILFSKENVRVAFFSSGVEHRNSEFVEKLLTKALGPEHYQAVKESIVILSRQHVTTAQEPGRSEQFKKYSISGGGDKKDISLALSAGAKIENAIFIDDRERVVYPGQERNYLKMRLACIGDFGLYKYVGRSYSSEGFHRSNGIFFLAGLLLELINNSDKAPIQEALFELNFERNSSPELSASSSTTNEDSFQFRMALKNGGLYFMHCQAKFYDAGLAALQEINPQLAFFHREMYLQFIRYEHLRNSLLAGIEAYIGGQVVTGDRDGLVHAAAGRRRAQFAKSYLQNVPATHSQGLLAIMYAIFKPGAKSFFGWVPGRSSRLAGLIADEMISGTNQYGQGLAYTDTIKSNIFDSSELGAVSAHMSNHRVAVGGYFDKTRGVRALIGKLIDSLDADERMHIIKSASRLEIHWSNGANNVDEIDLSCLPAAKFGEQSHATPRMSLAR